ncbi:MAG: DUF1822 family protein [Symploca sp. SIO2E9]|nr:DUF1822 family protein [Symploca sp. SIO2E9]
MTNYIIDDLLEFEGLSEVITLESEHNDQALELSSTARNESRQWQIYLQALGLIIFQEWLRKREPEISLNREACSVLQPHYANVIDAVCNLQVGEFKFCLIPTICFTDEEVIVPRAVIDLPEFAAHFYVVIGIEEDLDIAAIRGFLRYDQLFNLHSELQADRDWNYPLPMAWFNREPDELLLYLRCLEPPAIPLPEIPSNRQATLSQVQTELVSLLPQLRNQPLWKVLSWEQGAAVLTSPDLLQWLYQLPSGNIATLTTHLSDLLKLLTQQAVDASLWLQNQIEEVVQDMSWKVLPAPSPMRDSEQSHAEELEDILKEISASSGMEIPSSVGRAYQDLSLDETKLRLYALTWSLDGDREWSLLLILGASPNSLLPYGVKLRVSDQKEVLWEEELQADSNDAYLYTQIEGTYEEKFLATITAANRETQTLCLFEFSREQQ